MIKIKKILLENKCVEKFGQYLFGEYKDYYKKEMEKDTKQESEIFKDMLKFAKGDFEQGKAPSGFIQALKQLQKCTSQYSQVLTPPKQTLYRGTAVDMKNFIKKYVMTDKYKPNTWMDYEYNPRSEIQSWTTDIHTAEVFLNTHHKPEDGSLGILLMTNKIDDTFLFNPSFMNLLYSDESEVLRIGKGMKCKMKLTGMAEEILKDFMTDEDKAAVRYASKKQKDIDDIIKGGMDLYKGIDGYDDEDYY